MNYSQFFLSDTQLHTFSLRSGLELKIGTADEKGTVVFDKQKYISNFVPLLIAMVEVNTNDEVSRQVKIVLKFSDGSDSAPTLLLLNGLEKIEWTSIDSRCILNPDVPRAKGHIAAVIRLQYADKNIQTESMTLIDQIGGHCVEGVPVFHTGNELIWPDNLAEEEKPKVIFKPVPNIRLAIDPACSEREADAAMKRIVDLSLDAGRAILFLNLMCVQWDAFEAAGIPRDAICIFMALLEPKRPHMLLLPPSYITGTNP